MGNKSDKKLANQPSPKILIRPGIFVIFMHTEKYSPTKTQNLGCKDSRVSCKSSAKCPRSCQGLIIRQLQTLHI